MNEVIETIRTRRSVRAYEDKPVPKELLDEIVTAGLYAPSARNAQRWQFTVVESAEKLEQLRAAIAVAIGKPDYHRFYNAPALIIVTVPKDYTYAKEDCAAALENMFLAAHSLGVGSVWINQLLNQCDYPGVRRVLHSFGIPDDHAAFGCAALGYAAQDVPISRENRGTVVYA